MSKQAFQDSAIEIGVLELVDPVLRGIGGRPDRGGCRRGGRGEFPTRYVSQLDCPVLDTMSRALPHLEASLS